MKIKKTFQEFIKESNEYIDEKTISDIFIDLIDMDFTLTFVTNSITIKDKGAKYFIDLKKTVDTKYDYIENDFSYGVSNLEPMKLDVTKVLDALQSAKETLNSMEYTVGYEIEFNFNDQSQFFITCHIQHNDTIDDKDDNRYDRNMDDYADEDPRGMDEY
jgi:cAMP phosphodiesterase